MRKRLLLFIIVLIYSVICFSCKKEEDTNVPLIVINSPSEFSNYDITDTVTIVAKVTDDNNIAALEIVICNTNYLPVSDRITITPNVKTLNLYEFIVIDDFNLPSGIYYIKIRAFDGTNEKNLYRAININGIQRKFKSILSINQLSSNLCNIYAVDSSYKLLFSYSGNYLSSAINNNYQQFYICGNVNNNMCAYNLIDNSLVWEIPPDLNPPFPSFENLYVYNDILYVSCSQSYITGYNRFSNINFNSVTSSGYTPKKTFRYKDYLLVEEKSNNSELRLLNLYFYPTGTLKNTTNLSFKIKSIFYKDNEKVLIFGNNAGNSAEMQWFDIENQTFYSPHTMPSGQLKDVAKINSSVYLLLIENNIYWYQETTNSLTVFINNIQAQNIEFEDISQTIITSYSNIFTYYSYPSAVKIGEFTMPSQITDFQLLYNKEKE